MVKQTRKKSKTRAYFTAEDASDIRARYHALLSDPATKKRYSDPLMALAEELGIRIPQDIKSTGPLKSLIAGTRLTQTSAEFFHAKLGITFVEERVPLKGRPKRPCVLEDMADNGAKIGIVRDISFNIPEDIYFSHWLAMLGQSIGAAPLENADVCWVNNRDVPHRLNADLHFVLGASINTQTAPFISILRIFASQELGILTHDENVTTLDIAILAGSTEESIIRSTDLPQGNFVALDFGYDFDGYARLFGEITNQKYAAAIAPVSIINRWHKYNDTTRSMKRKTKGGQPRLVEMAQAFIDNVPSELLNNQTNTRLIRNHQMEDWLGERYEVDELNLSALNYELGVAIPKLNQRFDYKHAEKKLRSKPSDATGAYTEMYGQHVQRFLGITDDP